MVFDTSDDRFGAYAKRVSESARDKYEAPERAWDRLQELQNEAVSGALDVAGEQEFKQARRDWNREYKSTPVGIMASGVDLGANPFGAQDLYHDMSSQLAYDAPKTYDRMYPWNPNRLSQAVGNILGNTLPARIAKGVLGGGDPIVPKNVLAMRDRFPGADTFRSGMDEVIPPFGIAPLVPAHIRNSTLNKIMSEDRGIFGRGDLPFNFDYEELRKKRRLPYDLDALLEEIMAGEVETDTKELPEDKKVELETLLASPEFQALSQLEKEEILKEYGHESTTGLQ